jgi:hypothetical protein
MPVCSELLKKIRCAALVVDGAEDTDPQFEELTIVGKLPQDWMVSWLAANSDFDQADILYLKKELDEAIVELFGFATQLPLNLRCPEPMVVKAVSWIVATKMHDDMGKRLGMLKSRGIVKASRLCWVRGCYELVLEGGFVKEVVHILGDRVDVSSLKIGATYGLVRSHQDWHASLELVPFPGFKLHVFFAKTKTGPYKLLEKSFTHKRKVWNDLVEDCKSQWITNKSEDLSKSSTQQAKAELQHIHNEKKRSHLDAARSKAKETMEKKKQRKTISLS